MKKTVADDAIDAEDETTPPIARRRRKDASTDLAAAFQWLVEHACIPLNKVGATVRGPTRPGMRRELASWRHEVAGDLAALADAVERMEKHRETMMAGPPFRLDGAPMIGLIAAAPRAARGAPLVAALDALEDALATLQSAWETSGWLELTAPPTGRGIRNGDVDDRDLVDHVLAVTRVWQGTRDVAANAALVSIAFGYEPRCEHRDDFEERAKQWRDRLPARAGRRSKGEGRKRTKTAKARTK